MMSSVILTERRSKVDQRRQTQHLDEVSSEDGRSELISSVLTLVTHLSVSHLFDTCLSVTHLRSDVTVPS